VPRRLRRLPLWVWWIPVVWLASFPVGPTRVPQWHRVHAVPFSDPADKVEDLAINLLLFVPFGYSFVRGSRRIGLLAGAAAVTSASAEAMQLFSTVRYPSGTDVVYAVAGAMVGAAIQGMIRRYSAGRPAQPSGGRGRPSDSRSPGSPG
jgi:glycopeptide antibiotics resistance protein